MENNFSQKKKKNLKGNQDAGQNPGLPIKRKTSVYLYGEVKKKKGKTCPKEKLCDQHGVPRKPKKSGSSDKEENPLTEVKAVRFFL